MRGLHFSPRDKSFSVRPRSVMPVSRVLYCNISSTYHTQCRPCGMCLQSTIMQVYYYLRLNFPAEAHNKDSLWLFQHPILQYLDLEFLFVLLFRWDGSACPWLSINWMKVKRRTYKKYKKSYLLLSWPQLLFINFILKKSQYSRLTINRDSGSTIGK